jgi:hypothetical protein
MAATHVYGIFLNVLGHVSTVLDKLFDNSLGKHGIVKSAEGNELTWCLFSAS